MGKFTGHTIRINGWEKYNGRKDIKNCTWFRLENSISTSEALFGLEADERFIFVEFCAQASKKQSSDVRVNEAFISDRVKAKESRVESAIKKLIENGTFTDLNGSDRICTDTDGSGPNRHTYITDKQDIQTNTITTASRTDFDFESVYRRYPKKIGKSKGIKKLATEIKTLEDFEKLIVAVENYGQSRRGQDPKYTKHFSTFANEWRDWIEFTPEPSLPATPNNPAYRRMAGNQHALNEALKSIGESDDQAS